MRADSATDSSYRDTSVHYDVHICMCMCCDPPSIRKMRERERDGGGGLQRTNSNQICLNEMKTEGGGVLPERTGRGYKGQHLNSLQYE